jgi:hypothetical protein
LFSCLQDEAAEVAAWEAEKQAAIAYYKANPKVMKFGADDEEQEEESADEEAAAADE